MRDYISHSVNVFFLFSVPCQKIIFKTPELPNNIYEKAYRVICIEYDDSDGEGQNNCTVNACSTKDKGI